MFILLHNCLCVTLSTFICLKTPVLFNLDYDAPQVQEVLWRSHLSLHWQQKSYADPLYNLNCDESTAANKIN